LVALALRWFGVRLCWCVCLWIPLLLMLDVLVRGVIYFVWDDVEGLAMFAFYDISSFCY